MGILKSVAIDIESLVVEGYSDKEIQKAVGMDLSLIQYIIDYFRNETGMQTTKKTIKINKDRDNLY